MNAGWWTLLNHHVRTANATQLAETNRHTLALNLLVERNLFVFVVAVLTAVR